MKIPLKYNLRNLRVRAVATLLTAGGIALVTFVFVVIFALANGLTSTFVATGHPLNLLVLRSGATSETQSGLTQETVDDIRVMPGVADTSGELVIVINHPRENGEKSNVIVRGVTASAFGLRDGLSIEGSALQPQLGQALVGRRLAGRFAGTRIGDRIRIRSRDFEVVGTLDAGGQAFESEIWVDRIDLREEFKREYSSLLVRASGADDMKAIQERLKSDPKFNLKVVPQRDYYQEQARGAQMITGMGMFLVLILGAGAVFGAMNTMYAAVSARVREVATMRVLGFTRGGILLSFLLESLIIAAAGGAVGALCGMFVHNLTTGTTNWQTFSEVAFRFAVTPGIMFSGWVLALLVGLAGGLLPARRAARGTIAQGLREI